MKKIFWILFTVVMSLPLMSCSDDGILDDSNNNSIVRTWNLTPTMTATLDLSTNVLTIKTAMTSEAMPYFDRGVPWASVRSTITSIIIETGVTSIENNAFYGCSSLVSITIGNSVTSIGYEAFRRCYSLTSVMIPNSVTKIDILAFENCRSLTSVTFGNSVTSIGRYAFYCCRSLTSVTIPNSVTEIGYNAFGYCDNLKDITVHQSIPLSFPGFDYGLMSPSQASTVTLHVPVGTEHLYKVDPYWMDYKIVTFN